MRRHTPRAQATGKRDVGSDAPTKVRFVFRNRFEKSRRFFCRRPKSVDNSIGSDIIKPNNVETAVSDVNFVGKIDREIYKCVTKDIVTDEVIITEDQILHICERHPSDYEKFGKYIPQILAEPDYILEANKPNTAFVLKRITADEKIFN